MLDADHCLQGIAARVDCELCGGHFRDIAHRTAEQVHQVPYLSITGWCHDYVHAYLRFVCCARELDGPTISQLTG